MARAFLHTERDQDIEIEKHSLVFSSKYDLRVKILCQRNDPLREPGHVLMYSVFMPHFSAPALRCTHLVTGHSAFRPISPSVPALLPRIGMRPLITVGHAVATAISNDSMHCDNQCSCIELNCFVDCIALYCNVLLRIVFRKLQLVASCTQ